MEPTTLVILDDVGPEIIAELGPSLLPNIFSVIDASPRYEIITSPVCSPTRAQIMSRKPALANGIGGLIRHNSGEQLDPALAALPAENPDMRGKWHLGPDGFHVIQCGFDTFDGHLFNLGAGDGVGYNNWQRTRHDVGGLETWGETQYATTAVTMSALACYELDPAMDLLVVAYAAIHKPLHVAPYGHTYTGVLDPKTKAKSMLRCLDRDLGALFAMAEAHGHRIVLISDNGSDEDVGGAKGTLYEAGINNLMAAVGFDDWSRPRHRLNAFELFDWIEGTQPTGDFLYSEKFAPNGATRANFQRHDWMIADRYTCEASGERWKLIHKNDGTEELYELVTDPMEETGLQDQSQLVRLRAAAEDFWAKHEA